MRRFSLFEHVGYGDEFWDEAEGKSSGRPTCPTCKTEGLEKEDRMDKRQDVWRCKNCKSRVSEGDLKKTAEFENTYWTLKFDENQFGGLFDILTLAEREGILDPADIDKILDYLNLIYSGGPDEEGKFVLRLNGDEWDIFRHVYESFAEYGELGVERLKEENEDLSFDDIINAEYVFIDTMPEASSAAKLEDIPTMNKNPDGSKPFGNCPQCGVNAVDTETRECTNCGWDEDNACPVCFNDRSVSIDEDGVKYCNNCGWEEQMPTQTEKPGLFEGWEFEMNPKLDKPDKKENKIEDLERQFELPAVEHPLGPHTGNTQELYTSGGFVKGPDGRWLVVINSAGGQRDPEPGDWATIQQRSKAFNRPVPLTLVEDMGGAWKFRNGHHPSIERQVEDENL